MATVFAQFQTVALRTSQRSEDMQTFNLPSEAKQSVCRNQYHTPSCRPIIPRLSSQPLTRRLLLHSVQQTPTTGDGQQQGGSSELFVLLISLAPLLTLHAAEQRRTSVWFGVWAA